jgi:hypothetical protein
VAIGAQNRLGVIDGDNAGFPNGRRPGDDVVDIALRVVMGKLCTLNLGCAPADAPPARCTSPTARIWTRLLQRIPIPENPDPGFAADRRRGQANRRAP